MSKRNERIERMTPLQKAVYALKETQKQLADLRAAQHQPIAIVGMSCRFPGSANSLDRYWKLLCEEQDAIREVPPERWNADEFYDADPSVPGKMNTRWLGTIDHIDMFDNSFFGISEREARMCDPQQRLALELVWEALEDAGIVPASLRGSKTGVFLGIGNCEYVGNLLSEHVSGDAYTSTGAALCVVANRVSHLYDLRGPSLTVDTACSSSLVAAHMACRSLRSGESELALVGGSNLILSPLSTINLSKAGICSGTGKVRAFDAQADGYVRSDGAGMVVLKTLSAAERDEDDIYAVIRGSAVNHNGASYGLTAPRVESQEMVIRAAFESARLPPTAAQYVEMQGTGTQLGDAIEATALGKVMAGRDLRDKCFIGSVKTNIGHAELASGMASLIKVALAVKHRLLPATLNFEHPNPAIPFDSLPLAVQTETAPWPNPTGQFVAGVSAFGFAGTNAHLVVTAPELSLSTNEQAAYNAPHTGSSGENVLCISGKSQAALQAQVVKFRDWLRTTAENWDDVCNNAATKREHHRFRVAVISKDCRTAADRLNAYLQNADVVDVRSGEKHSRLERAAAAAEVLPADADRPETCQTVAQAYVAGVSDAWISNFSKRGRRVKLPTYAWQRRRLWAEGIPLHQLLTALHDQQPLPTMSTLADRQAPATPRPDTTTPFVAPRTRLECALAASWRELLRLEQVGIHDNFFELGGDSLQAAALLNQLQSRAGVALMLHTLFQLQTVSTLAEYILENHPVAARQLEEQFASPVTEDERPGSTADASFASEAAQSLDGFNRIRKLPRLASPIEDVAAAADVDNLTDDEVEVLLQQLLPNEGDAGE